MKVLVLCGGESVERNVSLASGNSVAQWLIEAGHEVVKYDPESPGVLHRGDEDLGGEEIGLLAPTDVLRHDFDTSRVRGLADAIDRVKPDVVFLILHGGFGEDGTVQAVLEWIGVPFTASGSEACRVAMNKQFTRTLLQAAAIPVSPGFLVPARHAQDSDHVASRIDESYGFPVVVKPVNGGSTVGLTIVKDSAHLSEALELISSIGDRPLVEKYFAGKEVTATVVDGECLPIIEIRPKQGFYDYANKYSAGRTEYICPPEISDEVASAIRKDAVCAFELIGCAGFARIDFLVSESEYVCLEINTLPGMTAGYGLVPKAAKAAGMTPPQLVQRILDCALRDRAPGG